MLTRVFDTLLHVVAGITIGFVLCLFLILRQASSQSDGDGLEQLPTAAHSALSASAQHDSATRPPADQPTPCID